MGAGTSPTAADRAFCAALLPQVSRTFALSIEGLPAGLGDAVRTAYLLCRVVDTIEDAPRLGSAERASLFDAFDRLLQDDGAAPAAFEAACKGARLGDGAADAALCGGAGAVFRSFRALAGEQRDAIRPHVLEMSAGMRAYCARAAEAGGALRLYDLEDLERYCWFVAGTVGHLLTALFERFVPGLSESTREALRARATSFGLGLQMVNIVKDVAEDFERGVCFLPRSLAAEHGVALDRMMDPGARGAALAVVRAVCARARHHLERAEEYTALWPVGADDGGKAGVAVRTFCVVPLGLALATLREVEAGEDTLRAGATPKVSRAFVARLVADARWAASSESRLEQVLARCRAGERGGLGGAERADGRS